MFVLAVLKVGRLADNILWTSHKKRLQKTIFSNKLYLFFGVSISREAKYRTIYIRLSIAVVFRLLLFKINGDFYKNNKSTVHM